MNKRCEDREPCGGNGIGRFSVFMAILISALLLTAPRATCHPAPGGGERKTKSAGSDPEAARRKEVPASRRRSLVDTLFWAPEIVVEGFRTTPDEDILDTSGFVGLIEIDSEENLMTDAATVLSRATGVSVRQYGGLGSYATMSIRGSSSAQVQFYLDGVPLNDSYSGMTDLSEIPLGDVDRIEIYRGFSPANFGNSSIGGTVNLVTLEDPRSGLPSGDERGSSSFGLRGQVSAGSFGSERYSLTGSGEAGPLYLRLHGGSTRSRGDFSFYDDNSTPYDATDDESVTRANNDFTHLSFIGKAGLEIPGFDRLCVSFNSFSKNGGVPGTGSDQVSAARLERSRRMTYVNAEPAALLSSRLHMEAVGFHTWTAERFSDPGGDIALLGTKTDNRIVSYGGSLRTRMFPRSVPASLDLFLEHRREKYHPVSLLPQVTVGPDRKRASTTVNVAGELLLMGERLILSASHRSEFHVNEFYDDSPFPWIPPTPQGRLKGEEHTPSYGVRFSPAGWLTIKGNYGHYYRIPTFFEMFGDLGTVTGDSGLEPETGLNRDIGLVISRKSLGFAEDLFFEATWLYNEIEDLILFFPNSQSTVRPQNIGGARIRGVELSFAGNLPRGLGVSGNYCWLESRDTGPIPYYNGKDLPGRPGHKASLSIDYSRSRWSASYRIDRIGSNYLDRYNTKEVRKRDLHGIRLVLKPIGDKISLVVEADNLGNERAYDVSGFPLPGRSWYTSMIFQL
ncbi:MAG TPA: TonB-dependent receptor [Candidatus Krumholzibacterium sp.]|nr:TonB-dependent receptor [Candidatus Krumholzibacterium sp.]